MTSNGGTKKNNINFPFIYMMVGWKSRIGMDVNGIKASKGPVHKSSRPIIGVETPVCPEMTPLGREAIHLIRVKVGLRNCTLFGQLV